MPSLIKKIAAFGLMAGLLVGCSSVETALSGLNKPVTDAEACSALENVFLKSEDGFSSIREKPSYHNKITLWKSRYQMIEGSCEIWQWSDKYSYVCSRVLPDEETAQKIYHDADQQIGRCLSGAKNEWQIKSQALPDNKGEVTEYLLNGAVRGSLKKVRTGGVFSSDWTVYLLVDSPKMTRQ